MPRRDDLESILLIGSGPIVIGQACEFDYSGTQACRVLREEGYRVILANSNPATIMTDPEFADPTYVEPLDADVLGADHRAGAARRRCCRRSAARPRSTWPWSWSSAASLDGYGRRADRRQRRGHRHRRGPRAVQGGHVGDRPGGARRRASPTRSTRPTAVAERDRPAGHHPPGLHPRRPGHRHRRHDRRVRAASPQTGLDASPISEILIERSIAGWKEYELEVMRDRADNCVVVCSIENLDPMGVHTGDSITVAPAQTLSDVEYQPMRDAAFACIRRVGVETGGSNVQFAVDPDDGDMVVIEMNPRVSRVERAGVEGHRVPDRQDRRPPRRRLHARRDPQRHHPQDAGQLRADHRLRRHQGPALGVREVPGHDRRARHPDAVGGRGHGHRPHVPRVAPEGPALARAAAGSGSTATPARRPRRPRRRRAAAPAPPSPPPTAPSSSRPPCGGASRRAGVRRDRGRPVVPRPDPRSSCEERAHLAAHRVRGDDRAGTGGGPSGSASPTPSWPSSGASTEADGPRRPAGGRACGPRSRPSTPAPPSSRPRRRTTTRPTRTTTRCGRPTGRKVVILGSGPNRIGQGIEFDYCCVHASFALRDAGFETVMVNCNPETVSTDYDTSDRLYFEPLDAEDVLNVIEAEQRRRRRRSSA